MTTMQWIAAMGFFLCAVLVLYVIVLYPLLLGWLARKGRPVKKQFQPRTVSILIAVYNGASVIADKLNSILALDYPKDLLEVIVISDGSTDGTDSIVQEYESRSVRLLRLPRGGKPAALKTGIAQSRGEILVLTDARQVLKSDSVRQLVSCFADPSVGAVSADLPMRVGRNSEETNTSLYWRYERWIRIQLGRLDSTFGTTGPFYAIRRSLIPDMPPHTLLDDMFLPLAGFFQGYRLIVDEEAIGYEYPFSVKGEFRRKVRTLAGNYQICWQYPQLLGLSNRLLFHFVSYKLGRLALPYFFIGMLICSAGCPWPANGVLLAGQAAFYSLAALDFAIPERWTLKPLTAAARTFVTMLAASFCAISVLFVPPEKLWRPTQAGSSFQTRSTP